MSDLLVVALLFQMILWQASFVAVAIDTTQVTSQRTLSDSTNFKPIVLNEANFLRNCLLFADIQVSFTLPSSTKVYHYKMGRHANNFATSEQPFISTELLHTPLSSLTFYLKTPSVSRP